MTVQMGNDGTDDDVQAKICSDEKDLKKKTCCTTPVLSRKSRDDWSRNDLETWTSSRLGSCKGKTLKVKKGLEVSLQKDGKDGLKVTSITIETAGDTGVAKKSLEQFKCGTIVFPDGAVKAGGVRPTNSSSPKFCPSFGPYNYERVKVINVTMGNKGTDDDVRVDICSDVNNVCCRTKLKSKTFALEDDWSRNDEEVWLEKHLGVCSTVLYKVDRGLKVSLVTKKKAKDGLVVNKLLVTTDNLLDSSTTYDCRGYTMTGKEIQENKCTRKTTNNRKTKPKTKPRTTKPTVKPIAKTPAKIPTKPKQSILSQVGSLFSGKSKTTTTTTKPTTTKTRRRPFRG